jgi:hypothetical protein
MLLFSLASERLYSIMSLEFVGGPGNGMGRLRAQGRNTGCLDQGGDDNRWQPGPEGTFTDGKLSFWRQNSGYFCNGSHFAPRVISKF